MRISMEEKEKLVVGPRWQPCIRTDWPTDCQSYNNFDLDLFNDRPEEQATEQSSIRFIDDVP
jgi:hypothetical protein